MNTKENLEEVKEAIANGDLDMGELAKKLKIAPSKRRVLRMTKDELLQYNALIFHKACQSLSSSERRMVQDRITYGVSKGLITPQEVADDINNLNALIHGELKKVLNNDSSSNE